jgi:hypothetical protein
MDCEFSSTGCGREAYPRSAPQSACGSRIWRRAQSYESGSLTTRPKWKAFQARYRKELRDKTDALRLLKEKSQRRTVTLLYGARDEKHNEAMVLKSVLGRRKE